MMISLLPAIGSAQHIHIPTPNDNITEYSYVENTVTRDHSIMGDCDYTQVWIITEPAVGKESEFRQRKMNSLKKGGVSIDGFEKYAKSKLLYRFDCKNRRISLISYVDYDEGGEVIRTYSWHEAAAAWDQIAPESVGEDLFSTICSLNKKKK